MGFIRLSYRPLGRCFYAHTEEELKERPPKTEEEILAEQMEAAHTIAMQDQADMWGMWPSHPAPAPALVAAPYGVPLALSHYSGLHTACWTFAMQAAAVAEAARLSANEPAQPYYAEGLYGMDYYSWTALKDAQRAMHAPSGGARHEIPTASASATASVGADPLSSGGGGTPNASSVDDFGKRKDGGISIRLDILNSRWTRKDSE
ncbi:hypothetical protein Pmar_PMAR029000 [Perkinsus marinus ATCC 50983]|uniref:Uncharacterized protein n=1 Tax=Perkinsus marinus (strain ATCC 50983 / TXsc) TaxID=423536 RepID=C5L684_PERM5|nr:hypothetical protein Pmar_PMAR029000 [Perkinsus marinus ATCC 50983]EER07711.1 hypothetical protein Pmar_PMAR029000 [Perkinsus marinus ATCC 50983]|eukprot:XP_002775895.1 hypothetical protein Pmar_PMAR029000 [Perkinsus marinus ATCC 50983]